MKNNTTPFQEFQLADHHRYTLEKEMMIKPDVIAGRGYRSIARSGELKEFGFSSGCPLPGLLLPIHSTDGLLDGYIYRPDNPKRKKINKKESEEVEIRYLTQRGKTIHLDCPPSVQYLLKDANIPLYIVDSPIKADLLASKGLCAIAIVGIWGFINKIEISQVIQHPGWDYLNLSNRTVRLLNDPESGKDTQIQKIYKQIFNHLKRKKASAEWTNLMHGNDLAEAVSEGLFEKSLNISDTIPAPKLPTYEINIDEDKEIKKPLCLLGNKAYAATIQSVTKTVTEKFDKNGEIIILDSPEKIKQLKLVVACSDGNVYGYQDDLDALDVRIRLREEISPENNWSGKGMRRFLDQLSPEPVDVFEQVIKAIDRFIDFHKSLADQRTMCEFIACWILATWFLDAFKVTGYLWITGEKGSGKTNLLILISQLSYLGLFISQSGSFASLRDMSDYSATLACDDAENITDPKKTDPDKRALLLAGNRKGLTIPIKELGPDKNWSIRYVNTYCARAFSAIRIPDSTMASRTIILPLVRTPDEFKSKSDPMDLESWPVDRRQLVDNLWSLALRNLPLMPKWDKLVGEKAKLIGRNLQPWRSVLAVAAWLEDCGVAGLFERMENLSLEYQKERPELEIADMTRVVILALCKCANSAINANSAIKNLSQVNVKVSDITQIVKEIIEEEDLDLDPNNVNNKKIGRILAKLRFPEAPRQGGKGSRIRVIDIQDLAELSESYKVDHLFQPQNSETEVLLDTALSINGTNGTNGSNGTVLDNSDEADKNSNILENPVRKCFACGQTDFRQRTDGGWICSTCHPDPNDNNNKRFNS